MKGIISGVGLHTGKMDKKLSHLLRQLKGKTYPRDIVFEFYRQGDEAFDALLALFNSSEKNENQLAHAMLIMFDMCSKSTPNRVTDLLDLCKKCIKDSSLKVRTASAKVITSILVLNDKNPGFYPIEIGKKKDFLLLLTESRSLGLESEAESFVSKYINSQKG